jgi:hypothetical protein
MIRQQDTTDLYKYDCKKFEHKILNSRDRQIDTGKKHFFLRTPIMEKKTDIYLEHMAAEIPVTYIGSITETIEDDQDNKGSIITHDYYSISLCPDRTPGGKPRRKYQRRTQSRSR